MEAENLRQLLSRFDLPSEYINDIVGVMRSFDECLERASLKSSIRKERDLKNVFHNCLEQHPVVRVSEELGADLVGLIPGKGGMCPPILYVLSGPWNFEARLNDALRVSRECKGKIAVVVFCPLLWNYEREERLRGSIGMFTDNLVGAVFVKFPLHSPSRRIS